MKTIKITQGFRFQGVFYQATAKGRKVAADVADFAVAQGFGTTGTADKANKAAKAAPENK